MFPWGAKWTQNNLDEKRIKGLEAGIFAQHPAGFSVQANYTYLWGEERYGYGPAPSWSLTTFNASLTKRIPHNQEHQLNALLNFRPKGEQLPTFLQKRFFKGIGLTALFAYKTGLPYAVVNAPFNQVVLTGLLSEVVGISEMASSFRLDLKVEKQLYIGVNTGLMLYMEVQNLLNRENIFGAYGYTGQPDEDGFLSSPTGLASYPVGTINRDLYKNIALPKRTHYGMPRLGRIGLRFTF